MVTEGLLGGPHPFRGTSSFNKTSPMVENMFFFFFRGDPGESKHIVMFVV